MRMTVVGNKMTGVGIEIRVAVPRVVVRVRASGMVDQRLALE